MKTPFSYTDSQLSSGLLHAVQMSRIFPDGKTFVDCTPRTALAKIQKEYNTQKTKPGFDLKKFILRHFDLPQPHSNGYESEEGSTVERHIASLWPLLTRQPDQAGGSLIPLPFPYIVPGGRFGEIYYWDSYFTMLGLAASGQGEMLLNMVKNFSHLIGKIGYIPNGNREYFIGRSQPPFYSYMVELLAQVQGEKMLTEYLPYLEKEYRYWMRGTDLLNQETTAIDHVVRLPGGEIMNRYWDENDSPRPESYREDVELAEKSEQASSLLYRNLRAGAESGWDFSSRWFKKGGSLKSIHTTSIIPVDLNCLLLHLEEVLARAYAAVGNENSAKKFERLAGMRKYAIQQYCWNGDKGFYFDYDFRAEIQHETGTLAAAFPLFCQVASEEQARLVAEILKERFLKPGGLVTTLQNSGQQWDAPNGWAPLQWIAVAGLENYGIHDLARTIASRWLQLNRQVYQRTGKLMEKYNVVDMHLEAGGGEYPGQDGFGWTNGVFLALSQRYPPGS